MWRWRGMGVRWFRRGSTPEPTEDGWPDVDDAMPPWTATIVLSWLWPPVSWGQILVAAGISLALVFIAVTAPAERQPWVGVIFGLLAAWLALDPARALWALRRRTRMTLTLGPDLLRLATANGTQPVVIRRDAAGWLGAAELGADPFLREITVSESAGPAITFVAGRAEIDVHVPGLPSGGELMSPMPVAVLLGEWWPHPARRMSRRGMLSMRSHWAEANLDSYPRRERRERWQLALIAAFFAVLCLVLVADPGIGPITRTAAAAAGVALLTWAVRIVRRRPSAPDGTSRETRSA